MNIDMDLYACYQAHAPLYRDGDIAYVSPMQAMKSAAGWYAGSWCLSAYAFTGEAVEIIPEPYSRDSDYMATEAEAHSFAEWSRA